MTHTTPTPTPTPDGLPELPEMESEADIAYVATVPEDWDGDYASIWKKLQVAERNKMQWRAHALEVRSLFAQAAPAGDALRNAFITMESTGGEGRSIVLKFNQRTDAYAMHDFLLKGGGKEFETTERAATQPAMEVVSGVDPEKVRRENMENYADEIALQASPNFAAPISEDAGKGDAHFEEQPDGTITPVDPEDMQPASPSGSTEQPAAASVDGPEFNYRLQCVIEFPDSESNRSKFVKCINAWGAQQREAAIKEHEFDDADFLQLGAECDGWRQRATTAEKERDDLQAHVKVCDGLFEGVAKERDDLQKKLRLMTHMRDMLANAIFDAAIKAGIARPDAEMTGPLLIMLAGDLAECAQLARPVDLAGLTWYRVEVSNTASGGAKLEMRPSPQGKWAMRRDVQALLAGGAVPVVPEYINMTQAGTGEWEHGYVRGWNDCVDAMQPAAKADAPRAIDHGDGAIPDRRGTK